MMGSASLKKSGILSVVSAGVGLRLIGLLTTTKQKVKQEVIVLNPNMEWSNGSGSG